MKYRTILFDLDGTLTDPKVGITTALALSLRAYGIEEEPEALTRYIGPPLQETYCGYYGFSPEQSDRATALFREYYDRKGWAENVPYPGIGACLSALAAAGKTLLVATSKPEHFAVRILEHFGLAQYFTLISGASPDDPEGAKKANVIRSALARAEVRDLSHTVMVGDRRHDVEGAREVGIPAVGVLYGYGTRQELEECGADALAGTIEQLQELLLG